MAQDTMVIYSTGTWIAAATKSDWLSSPVMARRELEKGQWYLNISGFVDVLETRSFVRVQLGFRAPTSAVSRRSLLNALDHGIQAGDYRTTTRNSASCLVYADSTYSVLQNYQT